MKEKIITAFWHKDRKAFVPWTTDELAKRTGIDMPTLASNLALLAHHGLTASTKRKERLTTATWHLTTLGRSEATTALRANEIVKAMGKVK